MEEYLFATVVLDRDRLRNQGLNDLPNEDSFEHSLIVIF